MERTSLEELRRPLSASRPFPNPAKAINPQMLQDFLKIATKELLAANQDIREATTGEDVRTAEDGRAYWQGYQHAIRELIKHSEGGE